MPNAICLLLARWWILIALIAVASAAARAERIGPEIQVNTFTAGAQQFPVVARLASGGYVVAWVSTDQDVGKQSIYGQRLNKVAVKLGGEFRINVSTTIVTYPKIAALTGGAFVAVWTSWGQDRRRGEIYARRFSSRGVGGAEFRVNTTTIGTQLDPAIAALDGGGFVVSWTSEVPGSDRTKVFAQRFDANARPVGAEFPVDPASNDSQSSPIIAPLGIGAGNFVIGWQSFGDPLSTAPLRIQAHNKNGMPFGRQIKFQRPIEAGLQSPDLARTPSGGFVVVYQQPARDGSGDGVFRQIFTAAGQRDGGGQLVNTVTADNQWQPQVASSTGYSVVVWTSNLQDGSNQGVYQQVYDSNDEKLEPPGRVNTTTKGEQWWPAVAAGPDGEFIVVWTSRGQDGSGPGVFAQRFRIPLN